MIIIIYIFTKYECYFIGKLYIFILVFVMCVSYDNVLS